MGLLPHCQLTASLPCPYGLFPMTASVLGAIYGSYAAGTSAIKLANLVKPFHNSRKNGKKLISFVVSLSNHERNQHATF